MSLFLKRTYKLVNLRRAWNWLLTNSEHQYKYYFRDVYKSYAIAEEENLADLNERLKKGIFKATQSSKVNIPKKSGLLRPISLLDIEDQIVYQAFINVVADNLSPKVNKRYYKSIFGHLYSGKKSKYFYKPWKKGYLKFTEAITQAYSDGYIYTAGFDLTAFYDSIDHNVLDHFLNGIGLDKDFRDKLIEYLREWTATEHKDAIYQGHGIPQGPLSSGMLSEVVLKEFDDTLITDKTIKYFRYVDDIKLFAKDENTLRKRLTTLDLISKKLGLFPQASKIDIHLIKNIDDEIKSISNPPEPTPKKGADQNKIRNRLKQLTKRYVIADETRFKFVLSEAEPNSELSHRLLRILKIYPHLFLSISIYFEKHKIIPSRVAQSLLSILKEYDLYPSLVSCFLREVRGRIHDTDVGDYNTYLKTQYNRKDEFQSFELKASCAAWFCQQNLLKYSHIENLLKKYPDWWLRKEVIKYIDEPSIGKPSFQKLLNIALRDKRVSVSICSAYIISTKGLSIEGPTNQINSIGQNSLRRFGLMKRRNRDFCAIKYALSEMISITPIINWKNVFGKEYHNVEILCVNILSCSKTDMNAWVNILDVFHDYLCYALFSHDPSIGKYTLGYIGRNLHKGSMFERKYPDIFTAVKEIHNKRYESHYSHPRIRRTGKPTVKINYSYFNQVKPVLKKAYIELEKKW